MPTEIAVIGGGLGGLAGAIRLASRGHKVRLVEQNPSLGGKMGEVREAGYRFDTGPSLLTMPFVLDDLFASVGKDVSELLPIRPLPIICRYFYPDGTVLDADSDLDRFRDNLDAMKPGNGKALQRFLDYSRTIYDLTADVFLFTPFHEIGRLLKPQHLKSLLGLPKIDAFRTVHQSTAAHFDDPRLVQLFDRYATYNGSDPFQAPATLNVIPHVEYALGGYYVAGGMYRLVDALAGLADDLGVEVHTGATVRRIRHRSRQVRSIETSVGEMRADAVLCNMDVVTAHRRLLPEFAAKAAKLERLEPSLSGMVFLWGVKGQHDRLSHHNILFSEDYRREFKQLFETLTVPDDPTVYISITERVDGDHAPDGCENWFVLVNMPYLAPGQDWDEAVEQTREAVLRKLGEIGIDLAGKVETEQILTPEDFAAKTASNRGSIYGLSSNGRSAAFRRPANRSRALNGLYFAGGSVHPGGGIPLTLLSGQMAAELISERF
ncbi:phytoene desaturase [bacterium]|nr:phytoene desaturase [bacterium]